MGKFEKVAKISPTSQKKTNEHVKKYITNIAKHTGKKRIDPDAIDKAVGDLIIPKSITNLDARVTTFYADFFGTLQRNGRADLPTIRPEKSVRILLARVSPLAFKKDMRRRMKYD